MDAPDEIQKLIDEISFRKSNSKDYQKMSAEEIGKELREVMKFEQESFKKIEEFEKTQENPYTQGLLKSIPTLNGDKPTYIKGIPPSLLDAPTQCRFIDRCPLVVEKCKQLPPKFKTETGYVICWLYEDK